jgi:hypothetical protein
MNFGRSPPLSLVFWGEWEAPSTYTKTDNKGGDLPKFITEPYYYMGNELRNSDPFVFGNLFYYSICQQGHSPQLRALEQGDIILFGSCVNKKFVMDTLFVVDDFFPYLKKNIKSLKKNVNEVFYDATLLPILKSETVKKVSFTEKDGKHKPDCSDYDKVIDCITDDNDQYRVYKGLMYKDQERFGNIFSYVPAVSLDKNPNGFARPNIVLDKIITQNLTQGFKVTAHTKDEGIQIWKKITEQVKAKGLGLMVECELPNKH